GNADAVQAAGDFIGILVEFAPGMELGHDDLGCRYAFGGMDIGRYAAAVVADRAGAIGIERDGHAVAIAGERLVDGVVDNLVNHVMEARAVIGVADIHAGTLAHGVETFQNLDRIRTVTGAFAFFLVGSHHSSYRRECAITDSIEGGVRIHAFEQRPVGPRQPVLSTDIT